MFTFSHKLFVLFGLTLLLTCQAALEGEKSTRDCRYGQQYLPEDVYLNLISWGCFEKYTTNDVIIHVCRSEGKGIYRVPCLKERGTYFKFNVDNSRSLSTMTKYLQTQESMQLFLQCYYLQAKCENEDPTAVTRLWLPDSDSSVCDSLPRSKFHIAMLSISLVAGIPALIAISYFSWTKKNQLFILHRNIIFALTIRTLITLLIQTEIILKDLEGMKTAENNGPGCQTLAVFETFFLNLVIGFWLVEAIYLRQYFIVQLKTEPTITIYNYVVPGLAFGFTIIWIIVMGTAHDEDCWIGVRSWVQWINEPIRIIFLGCHLYLVVDALRIGMPENDYTDKVEDKLRLRREALVVLVLSPLFLLQFCLNAGTPVGPECMEAFYYILYFIDGIQCAVVCLLFFYCDKETLSAIAELFGLKKEDTKPKRPLQIRTLDSLRDKTSDNETDIVYSSVLSPDRYEKTMGMYQKFNVAKTDSVTINDGEEFRDCRDRTVSTLSTDEFRDCRERSMSTLTQYYDADSLSEFYEPRDSQVIVPENILPQGAKEPNFHVLEQLKIDVSSEKLGASNRRESYITPVASSKYSSITADRSSSSSTFSDSSASTTTVEMTEKVLPKKSIPKIVLTGYDETETSDDILDANSDDESIKNFPQAKKVSVTSSSSDDTLNEEHVGKILRSKPGTERPTSFDSRTAVMGSSEESESDSDEFTGKRSGKDDKEKFTSEWVRENESSSEDEIPKIEINWGLTGMNETSDSVDVEEGSVGDVAEEWSNKPSDEKEKKSGKIQNNEVEVPKIEITRGSTEIHKTSDFVEEKHSSVTDVAEESPTKPSGEEEKKPERIENNENESSSEDEFPKTEISRGSKRIGEPSDNDEEKHSSINEVAVKSQTKPSDEKKKKIEDMDTSESSNEDEFPKSEISRGSKRISKSSDSVEKEFEEKHSSVDDAAVKSPPKPSGEVKEKIENIENSESSSEDEVPEINKSLASKRISDNEEFEKKRSPVLEEEVKKSGRIPNNDSCSEEEVLRIISELSDSIEEAEFEVKKTDSTYHTESSSDDEVTPIKIDRDSSGNTKTKIVSVVEVENNPIIKSEEIHKNASSHQDEAVSSENSGRNKKSSAQLKETRSSDTNLVVENDPIIRDDSSSDSESSSKSEESIDMNLPVKRSHIPESTVLKSLTFPLPKSSRNLPNIYNDLYDKQERIRPARPVSMQEKNNPHSKMWSNFVNKKLYKSEDGSLGKPSTESLGATTTRGKPLGKVSDSETGRLKKFPPSQNLNQDDSVYMRSESNDSDDSSSSSTESDSSAQSIKKSPHEPRFVVQPDSLEWDPQPWH